MRRRLASAFVSCMNPSSAIRRPWPPRSFLPRPDVARRPVSAQPSLFGVLETPMQRIAGIDEAGRGPLAGPVYAAAVILDPGRRIRGLDDSKKLTAERREAL